MFVRLGGRSAADGRKPLAGGTCTPRRHARMEGCVRRCAPRKKFYDERSRAREVAADTVVLNTAISACGKSEQWEALCRASLGTFGSVGIH